MGKRKLVPMPGAEKLERWNSDLIEGVAIEEYNDIMYDLCREYATIGDENFSEGTENWNLRDMVAEMDYTLRIYTSPGSIYYVDAQEDKEYRKQWKKDIARMKYFINKYKEKAMTMKCTESHCSIYD